MAEFNTRSAFIAIVGCPNVGKSSIINRLLGQKVAIVSDKPQTTRTRIMGVLTRGDVQTVFTDTPGLHRPRTRLGEKMVREIGESISGVDACLMVVEPKGEIREAEKQLLEKFTAHKMPVILAINKIDTLPKKELLMERILMFSVLYDFVSVIPVSAKTGDGFDVLLEEIEKLAQPSVHFFEEDTLTDQPERVLAAEIIREKLLLLLDKEVPHGVGIDVEKLREREGREIMDIEATIYCEKESHKGIIIGKHGDMLKKASTLARKELEGFFGCKVNLQTWVKVKEDWRNREGTFKNFGLN